MLKVSLEQQQKEEKGNEKKEKHRRYALPRSQAYPVETILNIYNNPDTNLYQVIGVNRGDS